MELYLNKNNLLCTQHVDKIFHVLASYQGQHGPFDIRGESFIYCTLKEIVAIDHRENA